MAPPDSENDPTVLFTTAGMHPGAHIPAPTIQESGWSTTRSASAPVTSGGGDLSPHLLRDAGNWSLGDYFRKEAITCSYEFLTEILGGHQQLSVTGTAGDDGCP